MLMLLAQYSTGQDTAFVQRSIRTLASDEMHGRGYTNDGMNMAASWLQSQFDSLGLEPVNGSWFQEFQYPVNVFGPEQKVEIDGKRLKPGVDFIIDAASRSLQGKFSLQIVEPGNVPSGPGKKTAWLVVDSLYDNVQKRMEHLHQLRQEAPVVLINTSKLTWAVAQQQRGLPVIEVRAEAVSDPQKLRIDIDTRQEESFSAKNVMARLEGTGTVDSTLLITAHYDHIGEMGTEAIFTGASDNASGTAMILDIARHFSENPIGRDIVFVAFAGEEAGLIGSKYFVSNPPIPLNGIHGVVNLDLMGSAEKGIAVVNAKNNPIWQGKLEAINLTYDLVDKIKWRGQAANSDHYWFAEEGIPAVFIYTMGNIRAYHDVYDRPSVIDLADYEDVFKLLTTFIERL